MTRVCDGKRAHCVNISSVPAGSSTPAPEHRFPCSTADRPQSKSGSRGAPAAGSARVELFRHPHGKCQRAEWPPRGNGCRRGKGRRGGRAAARPEGFRHAVRTRSAGRQLPGLVPPT
ncbi:predicted protein [Streptomyces sp. C]|nr:predicted protein [Streptomyces sp. C]